MKVEYSCDKCGAEVYQTEKFCHSCGNKLNWSKQQVTKPASQANDELEDMKKYLSRGKIVAIVLWAFAWVVLACGIFLFIFFMYKQNLFVAFSSLVAGIILTPLVLAISELLNESVKIRIIFEEIYKSNRN